MVDTASAKWHCVIALQRKGEKIMKNQIERAVKQPTKREPEVMFKPVKYLVAALACAGTLPEFTAAAVLEEVMVTAERRQDGAQSVPISMTVFDGDAINDLNLFSVGQLGEQVPNVRMYNDSGENGAVQVVIRGVYSAGQTYMAGPAALVYADDVVLDSYLSQGLAFFDVDRVEVLRGPQGTLFGRNATSGAIQIVSNGPGDEWEGYGEVTYGSYSRLRFEGAAGGPISDTAGVRISGFYDRRDGWFDNIHTGEKLGEAENFSLRGILEFNPSDSLNIFLKLQHSEQDQHPLAWQSSFPDPHALAGAGLDDALLANPGPDSDWEAGNISFAGGELEDYFEDTQFALRLTWDVGPATLTSVTSFEEYEFSFLNDADSTGADIFHFYNAVEFEGFNQELRISSNGDNPFGWIVGGFYSSQDMRSRVSDDFTDLYVLYGYSYPGIGFGDKDEIDHESKSYAVFAHTDYQWTDRIKTTHAVRYTRDELSRVRTAFDFTMFSRDSLLSFVNLDLHEDGGSTVSQPNIPDEEDTAELTWRLALEVQASEDVLWYGSVSTGYKAGLLGAIYDTAVNQYNFVEPETVISYELGFKSRWADNKVQLNGAVFHYDYEDYQTYTLVGNQFQFSRSDVNIPTTTFTGFEVELAAVPTDRLFVSLGVGYIDSEIDEYVSNALEDLSGNRPARAPDMDFNAVVRYRFDLPSGASLSPQFDLNYLGDYYPDLENSQQLGDYWRANIRLSYESPSSGIAASAWVLNIADNKEYQNVLAPNDSYGLGTDIHTRDLGRTFGISLSKSF